MTKTTKNSLSALNVELVFINPELTIPMDEAGNFLWREKRARGIICELITHQV